MRLQRSTWHGCGKRKGEKGLWPETRKWESVGYITLLSESVERSEPSGH